MMRVIGCMDGKRDSCGRGGQSRTSWDHTANHILEEREVERDVRSQDQPPTTVISSCCILVCITTGISSIAPIWLVVGIGRVARVVPRIATIWGPPLTTCMQATVADGCHGNTDTPTSSSSSSSSIPTSSRPTPPTSI